MEDFISVGLPNGDLSIKFTDGTSAVLEYSNARPATEFFTSVDRATPTIESKVGNRACHILLKNGKETVLQFFGKTKGQANTLCQAGNYSPEKWKAFLSSLSLVRLIRPDGTFSIVLCLPGGKGLGADKSLEGCTF